MNINLDEDESTNNNSDDKNDEENFSQINNKLIVSQEIEYDVEKRGVNKVETVILEQTQDITDNTDSTQLYYTHTFHIVIILLLPYWKQRRTGM